MRVTSWSGTSMPSRPLIRARSSSSWRGGGGCGNTSAITPVALPAPIFSSSAQARAIARAGAVTSMPRSKRIDASVRRPSCLLVVRTEAGWNQAASNTICVVASLTSESAPPITPPMAWARSASAMTSTPALSARVLPSSVLIDSPWRAVRTVMARPPSLWRSNACIGCPSSSST